MADPKQDPSIYQNIRVIDARQHIGDTYTFSNYTRGHFSHIHPEHWSDKLDATIKRLKRFQVELDDGLEGLRHLLANADDGKIGEDENREYNELLLSCDVLNIAIAGQVDVAMRTMWRFRTGRGSSCE